MKCYVLVLKGGFDGTQQFRKEVVIHESLTEALHEPRSSTHNGQIQLGAVQHAK